MRSRISRIIQQKTAPEILTQFQPTNVNVEDEADDLNERNRRSRLRLRSAAELYSEIVDPSLDNDGKPSCSAVEALERQSPFVGSTLAQHALALLARLFRYGEISFHGGFINLASGATSVLRIDPPCWKQTRGVNKASTPLRRHQEDASDGRANEGGVNCPDRA